MLKLIVENMILNSCRVKFNWFYEKMIQQFSDLINYKFPMI